jgi:hypothetical protein
VTLPPLYTRIRSVREVADTVATEAGERGHELRQWRVNAATGKRTTMCRLCGGRLEVEYDPDLDGVSVSGINIVDCTGSEAA